MVRHLAPVLLGNGAGVAREPEDGAFREIELSRLGLTEADCPIDDDVENPAGIGPRTPEGGEHLGHRDGLLLRVEQRTAGGRPLVATGWLS